MLLGPRRYLSVCRITSMMSPRASRKSYTSKTFAVELLQMTWDMLNVYDFLQCETLSFSLSPNEKRPVKWSVTKHCFHSSEFGLWWEMPQDVHRFLEAGEFCFSWEEKHHLYSFPVGTCWKTEVFYAATLGSLVERFHAISGKGCFQLHSSKRPCIRPTVHLVGGFNPIWNILVKLDHFPQFQGWK